MSSAQNVGFATYADHSKELPQIDSSGEKTWITRGANFIIAVSKLSQGSSLARQNTDEYFVFVPEGRVSISAEAQSLEAAAETLTIVPPGQSAVSALEDSLVVRVFSSLSEDLLALAVNNAIYADGAPGVAPLVSWPDPVDGFKLRHYQLSDYLRADSNMRIFRSKNLMVNVLAKRTVPRDITKLSPHQHTDFEQGSLAVAGHYVHHLRFPWGPDMTQWRADEHVEVASPSVAVIPPKVVHTSRNTSEGDCWLVDIFAPPRMDFSLKPGLVCNADEYPMPATS